MRKRPAATNANSGTAKRALLFAVCLGLVGCAGPHGERPALDSAVTRPGSTNYGFTGAYAGATGGGGFAH